MYLKHLIYFRVLPKRNAYISPHVHTPWHRLSWFMCVVLFSYPCTSESAMQTNKFIWPDILKMAHPFYLCGLEYFWTISMHPLESLTQFNQPNLFSPNKTDNDKDIFTYSALLILLPINKCRCSEEFFLTNIEMLVVKIKVKEQV